MNTPQMHITGLVKLATDKFGAKPVSSRIHACAVLAMILAMTCLHAEADHWISAGNTPSSDGRGFSLSVSSKTSAQFGWGLGLVFNSEMAGKDVLDYPVPHNDYTNLGTKRTGNTIGLDAFWFPTGDSTCRPYAGLGLYYGKRAEIAQSNMTGWYYTQQDKSALQVGGEIGMQYHPTNGISWGLGFHSIRGAFVSVGL